MRGGVKTRRQMARPRCRVPWPRPRKPRPDEPRSAWPYLSRGPPEDMATPKHTGSGKVFKRVAMAPSYIPGCHVPRLRGHASFLPFHRRLDSINVVDDDA